MSSLPQIITESHIIARLATFVLSFQFCVQKYIIKMTFSRSVICMYFMHPFCWVLTFLWTVKIWEAKRHLLSVYLSVTKRHPDTYGSVSGGNTEKGLSPTISAKLWLLRRCCEISCSSRPMTGDDIPDPRLDGSTSISDTSHVQIEV